MRKRIVAALSLALAAALMSGPGRADDATARKSIEAGFAKLSRAAKALDLKAVHAVGTPDFVVIQPNGTRMSVKQLDRQFAAIASFEKYDFVLSKLTVNGKSAVATARYTMDCTMKPSPNNGPLRMHSVGTGAYTWVKTPAGWKMKSMRALGEVTSVNGRKFGIGSLRK